MQFKTCEICSFDLRSFGQPIRSEMHQVLFICTNARLFDDLKVEGKMCQRICFLPFLCMRRHLLIYHAIKIHCFHAQHNGIYSLTLALPLSLSGMPCDAITKQKAVTSKSTIFHLIVIVSVLHAYINSVIHSFVRSRHLLPMHIRLTSFVIFS